MLVIPGPGLVIKSVTTSPTLAGEHMLFILQVSILSEQITLDKLEQNHSSTSFFRYFSLKFTKITLDKLE